MKLKRLFITCVFIASFIFTNKIFAETKLLYDGVEHIYTAQPITLMVNNKVIQPNVAPIIIDNRTLVPVRAVFEELGAEIVWSEETRELFIIRNDDIVLIKIDSTEANINGEIKNMDIPAKIINGSTMIPLRFISEAFNFDIDWNSEKRIASINSNNNIEQSTQDNEDKTIENKTEQTIPSNTNTHQTSSNNTEETSDNITQQTVPSNTHQTSNNNTEETNQTNINETSDNKNNQSGITESNGITTIQGDTGYNYNTTPSIKPKNETHNLVNITNIITPENNNETFKICANGKISSIQYDIIKDPVRLYVDIENSISNLNATISQTGSAVVKSIRTAQKSDAQNVTRVVFDLSDIRSYDISLSDDRTVLSIKFEPVALQKITFQNTNEQDIINIYGNSLLETNITRLSNPDRIIIDMPNISSLIGTKQTQLKGNFISEIRTSQFDNSTVRIVLDTIKIADYEITSDSICTTIKLIKPTYSNISYENTSSPRIVLNKISGTNIDIKSISHEDRYLDGYYKITFPGNYLSSYGYGDFKINDFYLDFVNIQNENGNTQFTFNSKNIYTYTITEDEKNIYINVLNPKSVYKQVVVIDPGHGGNAPGTVQNGLTEKNITLDVGNRLYLLLDKDPNIKVYTTRATDTNPSFDYRTGLANHLADMFVSIHCNSIISPSVSGTQVFYPNPSDTRGALSKQMSDFLMEGVILNTGFPNRPANQSMGYSFKVLRETTVPASLVEMGFLTNKSDATKLASPEGRQQVAQGIYEGIKKSFEIVIPKR